MPYGEPDPTDPSTLVGVRLPGNEASLRDMVDTVASELAQLGHDEESILRILRNPFYAGTHAAWRLLGHEEIRRIVASSVEFWGHCRVAVRDADTASGPDATATPTTPTAPMPTPSEPRHRPTPEPERP